MDRESFSFRIDRVDSPFVFENETVGIEVYLIGFMRNSPIEYNELELVNHSTYRIHIILDENALYEVEGAGKFLVKSGEFIIYPPNARAAIISEKKGYSKLTFSFDITPKDKNHSHFYFSLCEKLKEVKVRKISEAALALAELLPKLYQESPNDRENATFFTILPILVSVFHSVIGEEKISVSYSYGDRRVNKALEYIDNNISRNPSVYAVAKSARLSTKQLTRLFIESVGKTPGSYLKTQRMKYIKKLLGNLSYSMEEIVDILGYSDYAVFCKAFKRIEGTTPIRYRKGLFE